MQNHQSDQKSKKPVKQLLFNLLADDAANITIIRALNPDVASTTEIIRDALAFRVASFDPSEVKRARRKIHEVTA